MNLLYLSRSRYGGWVTFTTHLYHGLVGKAPSVHEEMSMSDNHEVIRITNRTEKTYRNMGNYVPYRNMCEEDVLKLEGPTLITAMDKNHRELAMKLLKQGAYIVLHDPTELRNPEFKEFVNAAQVIVVGKEMLKQMPEATFIPHPYMSVGITDPLDISEWQNRPTYAVSTSRLDFDKNSDWLFEINRRLPLDRQIVIRGAENRMYTKNKIVPKYPEYKQDSNRPKDERAVYDLKFRAAFILCRQAKFMTDFSVIKGDGGRTQYTFLEAIDAGAICLLHKDWIRPKDAMVHKGGNQNCIAFKDFKAASYLLAGETDPYMATFIRANASKLLQKHDATKIAFKYTETVK
jgi:hypothetical protein|tara:strand:- start:13134 stop:14174 length:1041 start_codon:yes stop_codon:yes gene_type:complete